MFKELIQRLQKLLTGSDINVTSTDLDIERLKISKLSRSMTSKLISQKSIDQALNSISLPNEMASIFKSVWTLYQTVPEINQAITIIVDNILAPDSVTKKSLNIINYSKDEQEAETLDKVVNLIIQELDLEEILEEVVKNFVIFGNSYLEISNTRPLLKKYNILVDDTKSLSLPKTLIIEEPSETSKETRVLNELTNLTADNIKPLLRFLRLRILNTTNVVPIYIGNVLFGGFEILGGGVTTSSSSESDMIQKKGINNNQLDKFVKSITDNIVKNLKRNKQIKQDIVNSDVLLDVISSVVSEHYRLFASGKAVRFIPGENLVHFKIPSTVYDPFGEPYMMGVLNHAKFLLAAEYSQIIYRLTRAPERRIFRVNIGEERRASKYLEELIRETKRKEYAVKTGSIDALINEVTMFEDYYVPVNDGTSAFDIDSVPGGDLTSRVEDLEYFRKKVISGLGIPAIYLIQEESSESKYTLSQENVKFARTIIRLQKRFATGLNDLLYKIFNLVFSAPDLIDKVEIQLKPPRAIQMERESELMSNISSIVNALREVAKDKIDVEEVSLAYLSEVFDFPIKEYELEHLAKSKISSEEEGEEGEI